MMDDSLIGSFKSRDGQYTLIARLCMKPPRQGRSMKAEPHIAYYVKPEPSLVESFLVHYASDRKLDPERIIPLGDGSYHLGDFRAGNGGLDRISAHLRDIETRWDMDFSGLGDEGPLMVIRNYCKQHITVEPLTK